jgi:hypothetical protein
LGNSTPAVPFLRSVKAVEAFKKCYSSPGTSRDGLEGMLTSNVCMYTRKPIILASTQALEEMGSTRAPEALLGNLTIAVPILRSVKVSKSSENVQLDLQVKYLA